MYNSSMKKAWIIGFSFAVFAACIAFAPSARAQGNPGFSGYPAFTPIPCTCSDTLWSYFAPLFLTEIPMMGPMVYAPYATIPYPYDTPTMPAAPHVGAYLPGVQACWMYIGYGCVVIPSVGVMEYVGNGVPGAYGM